MIEVRCRTLQPVNHQRKELQLVLEKGLHVKITMDVQYLFDFGFRRVTTKRATFLCSFLQNRSRRGAKPITEWLQNRSPPVTRSNVTSVSAEEICHVEL